MDSFAVIKDYTRPGYSEFPHGGVGDCVVVGDIIYAVVDYSTTYAGDSYKWGILEIDMITDAMEYHYPPFKDQPPFPNEPGNWIGSMVYNADNDELILQFTTGVGAYNCATGFWEYYVTATTPGLPPDALTDINTACVAYDNTRDWFFVAGNSVEDLYAIPRDGIISQIMYSERVSGVYTDFSRLVATTSSEAPKVALSPMPDEHLFVTWTDFVITPDTVCWAGDRTLSLLPYLVGETSFEYQIDAPGRLSFTLSDGHVFDPHNVNSLLRSFMLKGEPITCRLGETVLGTGVWTNHGKFLVQSVEMKYERGAYPFIKVTCEDLRSSWGIHKIIVQSIVAETPETALVSILTDQTSLTASDISVPTLTGSFVFDACWIEQPLSDIVDDVCHRFQHFVVVDHDNIVTFRPISIAGTVDRTVAKAEIIEFSPDDRYSDLTNRITVTGLSLIDFEVLHAEERVGTLSGTIGWYGFKGDKYVYYSDDESKRVKNPRLHVLETTVSMMFELAGGVSESISFVDPFDKYVIVTIEAPDLRFLFIIALAGYTAGAFIPDGVVTGGFFVSGGHTIPVGRVVQSVSMYLALWILASVANYQYEIYGQPVGKVKRQYSAAANDLEAQRTLGTIVENKFEGFLCNYTSECQTVADFEMMVTQGQRNRVKVKKIAHLQDEIGDTLTIIHPHTSNPTTIFVTNLIRKYSPGVGGYFIDEIEGWLC